MPLLCEAIHSTETLVGKIHWRRKWQPIPVFLPGKFCDQRSLVGCSPWGHKESDTTELTHTQCAYPVWRPYTREAERGHSTFCLARCMESCVCVYMCANVCVCARTFTLKLQLGQTMMEIRQQQLSLFQKWRKSESLTMTCSPTHTSC